LHSENYSTSKPLKVSPEKSQILSCDTLVANEGSVRDCGRKNGKLNEHLEGVNVDGKRVGILDGLLRKYSIRIVTGLLRLSDWLNLQELVVTVTAVYHIISKPQEIS
jgi:hypothetical protein